MMDTITIIVNLWSGPACPECGETKWKNITYSNNPKSDMICRGCGYICGPEIKHAHKKLSPDDFFKAITK